MRTPIIGLVTEDVYHEGRLVIPAGTEVHGTAQTDPTRERIASGNHWTLVWHNGDELKLSGVALDREQDPNGYQAGEALLGGATAACLSAMSTGASTVTTMSSREGNRLVTTGLAAVAGAAAATNAVASSAFSGGQGGSLINALANQNDRFSARRGSNGKSPPGFENDDLTGAKAVKSLINRTRNPSPPNSGS
jgi:hypothetical protein